MESYTTGQAAPEAYNIAFLPEPSATSAVSPWVWFNFDPAAAQGYQQTPEQEIAGIVEDESDFDELAEEYQFCDHVLPSIEFGDCVSVDVKVSDEEVTVNIGGRIIVWERGSGEVLHSGAYLDDDEIEEIGSELADEE